MCVEWNGKVGVGVVVGLTRDGVGRVEFQVRRLASSCPDFDSPLPGLWTT